jgi:hypothetical protein
MRPLQDCQLVAQGKVFQLQCCSSSKPRSDANQCGKQSSKHQVETLAAYPDKINDLNLNEVIGRDRAILEASAVTLGLPSVVPLALAFFKPERTRSTIRLRSNSAMAPII